MIKRQLTNLVILVVAALLVTSCTKKAEKGDNTFNFALRANVKGMDPASANDHYSNLVISQIYETLYQYHYLSNSPTLH
mgnify:CR=1 FL=1